MDFALNLKILRQAELKGIEFRFEKSNILWAEGKNVFSYARVANDPLQQKKVRKTKKELILQQITEHNAREKVRPSKITTDEITAMGNVLLQTNWFQRRMKIIYQLAPSQTCVPTKLLC